jgi:hypothetical protein
MRWSVRAWLCCAVTALTLPGTAARSGSGPDPSMMLPVNTLRRAMERFDQPAPPDVFSPQRVTIVENFEPYVFEGDTAAERWWHGFRAHAISGKLANLRAAFGAAQDYEQNGDRAFFTLPTRWTGTTDGRRFVEHGGWAFVLVREGGAWRIRSYAWAVTAST